MPHGMPTPITFDGSWVGWALSGHNAIRSRAFLKSDMEPQTLWPSWNDVSAEDWTSTWHAKPGDPPSWFTRSNAEDPSFLRSLWPEGIYQPIRTFEGPSLSERCKGSTHPDDAGAMD